ncbi:MAG: hypothetical protein ACOY94_17060 [Bacillota bacterium]
MKTDWTQFQELASSTGFILMLVILLWATLAVIIYWAYVSGATSMGENVKYKVVEDDEPVSR